MNSTDNQLELEERLKLKNQLCFPLYAASRDILKKYTPFLADVDLTYTQYLVMLVLWEEKSLTVGDLCQKLFLDTGTLSPLLKSMEKKNLLVRTRDSSDERIVRVSITDEGQELKQKALQIPGKVGTCINLTQEEATSLYRILYKILLSSSSS